MHSTLTIGGLVIGAALLAGLAPAQPENPGSPRPGRDRPTQPGDGPLAPRGPREGAQSIEGAMKTMNRAFRTVRQNIARPDAKDQVLAAINQMQAGAVAAKGQALKAEGNAEAQAARALEYRRAMIDLVKALVQLESDVLEGKNDAAAAGVEKIQAMREDMHKRMGVSDDDEAVPPPGRP